MIVLWVLSMLCIFGTIAAWGVREDEKRRWRRGVAALVKIYQTASAKIYLLSSQYQQLGLAFSKLFESFKNIQINMYKSEGHVQYVRGDGSILDPSVKGES